jgi:hypothetical protein
MAKIPSADIQQRDVVPFLDMEFTPLAEKSTPDYCRSIAESIYSYYVNNKTELSWDFDTRVDMLRAVGQGKQSVDYYKRYSSGNQGSTTIDVFSEVDTYFNNSADANRYGWMNTIQDNLSPISNIKTIAKSIIKRRDYDIRANVIDVNANDTEEKRMIEHYGAAKYKPLTDFYRGKWGLPQSQTQIISDSYNDLLEIKRLGGFKAHYILGLEQLIKHSAQASEWDDNLKEKLFDDIFDTGYGFAYAKHDENSYTPKWCYIDVKDMVVQYSKKNDFSDIDYIGHFEYLTINQLRSFADKITNGEKTGLTKEDWREIGKQYADYEGNPGKQHWKDGVEMDFSGNAGSAKTCVLHIYWRDYDKEKNITYTTPYGGKKRRVYRDGETVSTKDKLTESRIEKVYYCSWIVGTKFIFNYGALPNQIRKNLKESLFPYAPIKLREKSFTERLVPIADIFAIAWMRFCNAIANAQNDFYYIDINALAEVEITTGKNLKWNDIINMMRERNVLLGDSSRQIPTYGGTGAPIQKIQGTLIEDITKELVIMDQMYAKIEQLIGIPPVALGSSPQNDQAVRTTQMSISSSNMAMELLVSAVMRVKKELGGITCSMWQNALKYNENARQEAAMVIGMDDVQGILAARNSYQEFGITLQPRPSEELKQSFLRLAEIEVASKRSGQAGIDSIDFMWLQYQIESGCNFLEALYRLTYLKKQDEKRVRAEQEANIKQQGEINKQNMLAAEGEKRKTVMMQSEQSNRDAINKATYDNIMLDKKGAWELRKIQAEWMKENGRDPLGDVSYLDQQFNQQASSVQP